MTDASPFPEEFQDEVFKHILDNRQAMVAYHPKISPSFFTDPLTSSLWAMIRHHFTANKVVPSEGTVYEVVRKTYPDSDVKSTSQREALSAKAKRILSLPKSKDPYIADSVREFVTFSAMCEVLMESAEAMASRRFDPKIVEKFRAASKAGDISEDIGTFAKGGGISAIDDHADPDRNPPIPTGLFHLDMELGGGLRRGELGIFMAPPKGSKSTILLNFAHNVPTVGVKKNCLYLTLELSESLQALRFAIRTTMLDKSMILRDPTRYRTLYQRKAAAIFSPKHDCIFKFMPPYACTASKVRAYLDHLREDHGINIDMICVDYLELMGCDEKMDKDYMAQTRITTDLRQIAVDYNAAIWTASRTNREAEKAIRSGNWISPEHMSGAYEKLGVCDVAIAGQKFRDGMAIVPIAFRNEGGNRKIDCALQPSKMCITTRGFISEDEKPESNDCEEEDRPRGGGKYKKANRGKPGDSFPDRTAKSVQF